MSEENARATPILSSEAMVLTDEPSSSSKATGQLRKFNHPYSTELYNYLRNTPKEYDYILTPASRKEILRRVSWYLLSKDDRLADLVPLDEKTGGAPREELQDEFEVPIEYTEVRRGQPCGHVFKRGEGVYRCKNCAMDDTCVLCTRCFQATDHTGHDTSFSVNSGTGGCCDCGDPEAWKIPLRCRHHNTFEELEEVGLEPIVSSAGAPFVPGYNNNECPASIKQSIELTIAVVLEFILETFATSPISLRTQFDERAIQEDADNASFTLQDPEKQTKFAVVLWNDEVHSFQDVIDQCTQALQCSTLEARKIAETVDVSGRDVLRVSTSIAELIDIATIMTNVSLNISIRAARDVFREQLSASLLIWLRDLACCKFRPLARVFQGKVNNEIRVEISKQLCGRWIAPSRNEYLADILRKQYDFHAVDIENIGDELMEGDDEDDGEDDEEDEDEEDEEYTEGDMDDYSDFGERSNLETSTATATANSGSDEIPNLGNNSEAAEAAEAIGMVVDPASDDGIQLRGRRRLRSDSNDSLRHQGEERGSPRNYPQPGPPLPRGATAPPQSLWLAETNGNNNTDGPDSGRTVPFIHAAVGAAVDAARTSLARIMQPTNAADMPQHSPAPGAYPPQQQRYQQRTADDRLLSSQFAHSNPDFMYDDETAATIERVLQGCGHQRLDWFLIFDLQLWKEVRSGLRELYMATLMLDSLYKMQIALTFARNYPRLSRAFLTQDRAPEHSVLLFSVQLFTAPTLSSSLVDDHRFLYIILDVLKKFFVHPTPMYLRQHGVILCDTESFRNRRYFHVFHDMRYLAGTPQVRNWVSKKHKFLATYVGFIGLFQGMNPNRRAILQHVEFEADTWVNAFNVTLQVAKSCRQFAECYGISSRDLLFAIRGTLRRLKQSVELMAEENCAVIIRNAQIHGALTQDVGHTVNSGGDLGDTAALSYRTHHLSTLWGKTYEVVDYDVSTNPISFHHPLHWFTAELCQHVKLLTDEISHDYGFRNIKEMVFTAFNVQRDDMLSLDPEEAHQHPSNYSTRYPALTELETEQAQRELLRILDYPIRVCVVMAQIRAGLWVRNGYVIRSQSHHYREVSLRENTYDQDIVMIQFFLSIWPDPDHILMSLIDRFGLYDWFSGRPYASRIYDVSQMTYMVEELLNVLIVLVAERHVATGKNALDLARREIVHGCLSPISYSELTKKIPERLAEHTEFDNLLQEMADYRGPVSVMDFGLYELKDEYLDEVDPYFIHYTRNQREEVEELLRERLKKRIRRNGGNYEEVPDYIPPKLETIRFGPFQRIGMVLHTPLACQMLFYALLQSTHSGTHMLSETIVDETLQLIVLALEDGMQGAVAQEIGGTRTEDGQLNRGGLWRYSLEQGYTSMNAPAINLLGLLLALYLRSEMKQWKPKLDYIIKLFREGGPKIVNCIDDYYRNLEATPIGSRVLRSAMDESNAAERRKQAAKARQDAILADFANQQQNFLEQYGDEFDDLTDDEDPSASVEEVDITNKGKGTDEGRLHRPLWNNPGDTCIVCQEECDGAKPYGILTLIQASRVARTAPMADVTHVIDILRLPGGLDTNITELTPGASSSPDGGASSTPVKGTGYTRPTDLPGLGGQMDGAYGAPSGLKSFPVQYHDRGLVANTCSHLMHMRCFVQYCQGVEAKRQQQPTRNHPENPHRREYLCPLCKSLGNVLLPVLPHAADYDPLVFADRDPERFSSSAGDSVESLEKWLHTEWQPFVNTLMGMTSNDAKASDSSKNTPQRGSDVGARERTNSFDVESDSGSSASRQVSKQGEKAQNQNMQGQAASILGLAMRSEETIASGLVTAMRNAGGFPGGLGLQTFLSRFLPPASGAQFASPPGAERLAVPLELYIKWLVEQQQHMDHHHHGRRHHYGRTGTSGTGASSQCSTPDGNSTSAHTSGSTPLGMDRAGNDFDSKFREQLESYRYMYNRLYEVLQNVQRDNHVGMPPVSLFSHLLKNKEKGRGAALTSLNTNQGQGTTGIASASDHDGIHNVQASRDRAGFDRGMEYEDDDEDDEDEEDDEYGYNASSGTNPNNDGARVPSGYFADMNIAGLPPFLQTLSEHLRSLSAGTNAASLVGNVGARSDALDLTCSPQPYPFDRAASALFGHTVEVLEISQRGVRNPPVFDHEDHRVTPSGTLSDAIPEPHAVFMHSLGKIVELQYRTVLAPVDSIGSTCMLESDESGSKAMSPAQRLQNLAATAPASGMLLHTRQTMLRDIANTVSSVSCDQSGWTSEALSEQSRWLVGQDGMPLKPFLMRDPFTILTELSVSAVIPLGVDIWHMTRMFLIAEVIRACVAVGDSVLGEYIGAPKNLRLAQSIPPEISADMDTSSHHSSASTPASYVPQPWVDSPEARETKLLTVLSSGTDAALLDEASAEIYELVQWVILQLDDSSLSINAMRRFKSVTNKIAVTKLVTTLILPFLRRVALLFYLQYGVDLAREAPWLQDARQTTVNSDETRVFKQSEPEVSRLLKLLHLPRLHKIFTPPNVDITGKAAVTAAAQDPQPLMTKMVEGWLSELQTFRMNHMSAMSLGAGYTMAVPVAMPMPYMLTGLPNKFEILFEKSAKAFCPRCSTVPGDPALCLLCGHFVCAQSFCCERDGIGECNMHMKTCGGTIGIYLLVKKCGLLLLHHDNGCFMSAPYLDQHGEVDLGLKRGRPLFINSTRYDELRKLVLTQKIPVFIARKIEQSFDIGGWLSL